MLTKSLVVVLVCVKSAIYGMDPFVVGGAYTKINSYPHSAYLGISCVEKPKEEPSYYSCGSSILNQKIVITAGHCLYGCRKSSKIIIKVGDENQNNGFVTAVKRFKIHENYDDEQVTNDIALAALANSLHFGPKVQRVAVMSAPPAEKKAHIAGWGRISEDGRTTIILRATVQKLLSDKTCEDTLGSKPDYTICGQDSVKSSRVARGDSGSALIVRKFIQVGIVSYRSPDKSNTIGVYTKVSSFYNWIVETSKYLYCG